ncbi:hypothetical protein ACX3UO_03640 [Corynebacterium coyleae]
MDIIIRRTPEEVGAYAADCIEPFARQGATIGLATGSSPNPTYKELIRRHRVETHFFDIIRTRVQVCTLRT